MANVLQIEWSFFIQRTVKGTLLEKMTINAAWHDFEQWAFYDRTGVVMGRGQKNHMVPWKAVLQKLDMSPGQIDRKKLFSALEVDLEGYEEAASLKRNPFLPMIEAGELKTITANLHKLFAKFKAEEFEIAALAAFYMMENGGELEEVKNSLRGVIRHPVNAAVFSIGSGGSPKVRRLKKADGKPTGLEPFDNTRTRKPKSEEEPEEEG